LLVIRAWCSVVRPPGAKEGRIHPHLGQPFLTFWITYDAGVKQSWILGLGIGSFQLIIYGSFAIALVYGAFRVASGAYTGGTVMNVLIAVLLGGFAIMQGAPNLQYIIKVSIDPMWVEVGVIAP